MDIIRLASRFGCFSLFMHPYSSGLLGVSEEEEKDVELAQLLLSAAENTEYEYFDRARSCLLGVRIWHPKRAIQCKELYTTLLKLFERGLTEKQPESRTRRQRNMEGHQSATGYQPSIHGAPPKNPIHSRDSICSNAADSRKCGISNQGPRDRSPDQVRSSLDNLDADSG